MQHLEHLLCWVKLHFATLSFVFLSVEFSFGNLSEISTWLFALPILLLLYSYLLWWFEQSPWCIRSVCYNLHLPFSAAFDSIFDQFIGSDCSMISIFRQSCQYCWKAVPQVPYLIERFQWLLCNMLTITLFKALNGHIEKYLLSSAALFFTLL